MTDVLRIAQGAILRVIAWMTKWLCMTLAWATIKDKVTLVTRHG